MRETSILFTPGNYEKAARGEKTQTRRIIKPQPMLVNDRTWTWPCDGIQSKASWAKDLTGKTISLISSEHCPYGTVGDRLYVKEGLERFQAGICYRQDHVRVDPMLAGGGHYLWQWQRDILSPLHMPKWAARLWLELTDVRVEQLGSITEADAQAEGVNSVAAFVELWKSINKTWEPSLWIWVLDYRKVRKINEITAKLAGGEAPCGHRRQNDCGEEQGAGRAWMRDTLPRKREQAGTCES